MKARPPLGVQFLKFGIAGLAAALVHLLVVSVFNAMGIVPWLAILVSLVFSKHTGFFINRKYTFKEARHQSLWSQYVRFWSSTSVGSLINYSVSVGLTSSFALFYEFPQLAVICGIACGMFFNFAASRHWVFHPGSNDETSESAFSTRTGQRHQEFKDFIKKSRFFSGIVYRFLNLKNSRLKKMIFQSAPHFKLRANTSDEYVFNEIFAGKYLDIELPLEPRWIIDAGANIGLASLFLSYRYPQAQIIAIEAEKENFEILQHNFKDHPRVHPIYAAIWPRKDFVSVKDRKVGSFGFTVIAADENSQQLVPTITVKECQERFSFKTIDLFKVDIEGSEKELFEHEDWLEDVNILIAELHDRINSGCEAAFDQLHKKSNGRLISTGNMKALIKPEIELKDTEASKRSQKTA